MTDRIAIPCINPQQAHKALTAQVWPTLKAMLLAGHRMVLEVKPAKKSRDQEEKYHAVIGEIAVAMRKAGSPWDAEDWKRLLLEQFATDTDRPTGKLLPSLDGKRLVQTHLKSREFTKQDASEFLEWLLAWCADKGIELTQ